MCLKNVILRKLIIINYNLLISPDVVCNLIVGVGLGNHNRKHSHVVSFNIGFIQGCKSFNGHEENWCTSRRSNEWKRAS